MRRRLATLILILAGIAPPALAQESPNYRLEEHSLNDGAVPAGGAELSSPGWRMTLASLGDPLPGGLLAGASFRIDGLLAAGLRPPGEVTGVGWVLPDELTWDVEPTVGSYNVYRDGLATLPGGYGGCFASALVAASVTDPAIPASGQGYFYLVTAVNLLAEEGTAGESSSGVRSLAAACP